MSIQKFNREMLQEKEIYVRKKSGDLSYKIHWHDYFEMIFYKNCNGVCILNGEEYPVKDNSVFFLVPGDFHRIDVVPNENATQTLISFSESVIDKAIAKSDISAKVLYEPSEFMLNTAEMTYKLFSSDNEFKENSIYHLLNVILIELFNKGKSPTKNKNYVHPAVSKAMLYILTDPSKNISLTEIADMCGINPSYFSNIFHSQCGETFKSWLIKVRIEYACRLLEDKELSVLDVCFESGFNNLSHFGKCFKEYKNMTPSEYRKSRK